LKGKVDEGFEQAGHGIKQVKTGSNGDPADNGPKLGGNDKTEGDNKGEGGSNSGSGGGK
jgi:hypothetical protein